MSKSSADALDNLAKVEQRRRKWALDEPARNKVASAGGTCVTSMPGTVPSWRPSSASEQPPARHEPFFQYLEPLKLRYLDMVEIQARG
eukprot:1442886-Pyramimonas_sp.AAC.1